MRKARTYLLPRIRGKRKAHVASHGEPVCRLEINPKNYVESFELPADVELCTQCGHVSGVERKAAAQLKAVKIEELTLF